MQKAGMIRDLSVEYDIIMARAAQIKSAILMLQAIPEDDPKRIRRKPIRASDNIKGIVLGNIPIPPSQKFQRAAKRAAKAQTKASGKKRAYTKKSEFWAKPHPRKKK